MGTGDKNIELEVFDDDFGSENFIGSYTLSLTQAIKDTDKEAAWHTLSGCKTGKLLFSTVYVEDEEPETNLQESTDSTKLKDATSKDMSDHKSDDQDQKPKDEDKPLVDSSDDQNKNEEKSSYTKFDWTLEESTDQQIDDTNASKETVDSSKKMEEKCDSKDKQEDVTCTDQVIKVQEEVTFKHEEVNQTTKTTSITEIKNSQTLSTKQEEAPVPANKSETSPSIEDEVSVI